MTVDGTRDVGGIGPARGPQGAPLGGARPAADFGKVLRDKLAETAARTAEAAAPGTLKFSAHAKERLEKRGIALSQQDLAALDAGLAKARAKGAREALFLMRGLGFIVGVAQGTVVTAMDATELKDRVFTNIDSTIIL